MLKEDRVKKALVSLYDDLKLSDSVENFVLLNETTYSKMMFDCFEAERIDLKEYLKLDYITPIEFKLPSDEVMERGIEVFESRCNFVKWLHKYNSFHNSKPIDMEESKINELLDIIEYGGFA